MRIDSGLPNDLTMVAERTTAPGAAAAQKGNIGQNGNDDEIMLSDSQDTVQMLESQLSSVPEVREAKVNALRAAIQSGQYHVSPGQIAAAMYQDIFSL
jgi:flagellar biosynthesis anti-sigma factor FlgM